MSAEPIIYGLIFIGVLVLVEGLYLVAFGKSISLNSKVNRRLEMLEKGAGREEVLDKLRKEMQQHMDNKSIPIYSMLAAKAQKAAIAFAPKQLIMIMAGLSVVAFLGLTIGTSTEVPVRILISVGIGVGAVYFWISSKAKKRMDLIEEQLPDAVELMVRSLRVGHPFTSAISIVSKEIQDPLDLQGPDDPPWEGVHVFRNAKARLHQRRRAGEVGWFHTLGWYLYHLMTFWTLPNRLVEWEVRKIKRMNRKALPKAMVEWSESLPEDQWTKPSEELKRQSQRVLELQKADPRQPVTEIFAQVSEEFSGKSSMTA